MKYLHDATHAMFKKLPDRDEQGENPYIGSIDNKLHVTLQDGPIQEVGVNGIQVTELLELVTEMYRSLNKAYPCRENSLSITKLEEALHWQEARTRDRVKRKVEGTNND